MTEDPHKNKQRHCLFQKKIHVHTFSKSKNLSESYRKVIAAATFVFRILLGISIGGQGGALITSGNVDNEPALQFVAGLN